MFVTNLLSPKISVIIPTYNRSYLIKDAIESVLNQTYQDFELIIIDDGSTDNTKEALAEYGERLQYIYQENQGRSAARNHGINLAKGEYIAFLDSDDVWFPDKLARQVPILESAPENVVLVHGYKCIVDLNLQPIPGWELKLRNLYTLAEMGEETYENYLDSNCIFTSTILVRKTAIIEVDGYDTNIQSMEDLDIYLRLLLINYNFAFISDSPLIKYRWHAGNTDSLSSNYSYVQVYEKHLNECLKLNNPVRIAKAQNLIYQALAKTHYRLGNYNWSRKYWQNSLIQSWKVALIVSFWRQYFGSWIRQLMLYFKL
ncbi:MAG: glycosyltransferase family 2 protein [Nostoc sp. C3-bin3]|nr:glycosyltransferase family 2 protein [Nostoc sp. C3-bin3]